MMKERPLIWHLRNNMQQSVQKKKFSVQCCFAGGTLRFCSVSLFQNQGKGQDVYETSSAKGF